MAHADSLTLLLINEQAEEIKLTTQSMRGFYPGCRVEAVYSAEEALEWTSKQEWNVILLDEQLPRRSGIEILPEIRQRAPSAAIIVQAERNDAAIAVQVMRAGADYCLFKKSPAFLNELPIITREILEKRDLRMRLNLAQERYLCLSESLGDVVYELDAEGRFLTIGQAVAALLGYSPQELIGAHYSKLIHPDDMRVAEGRFNERRTGDRTRHTIELRLMPQSGKATEQEVRTFEVNATGLYSGQLFMGTVGVVRDITGKKREHALLKRLQQELCQAEKLIEPKRRTGGAVPDLHRAVSSIGGGIERRLEGIDATQGEDEQKVTAVQVPPPGLLDRAHESAGEPSPVGLVPVSINHLLEDVLFLKAKDLQTHAILVEPRLMQDLPRVLGDPARLQQALLTLITEAELAMWTTNWGGQMLVRTRVVKARDAASGYPLSSAPGPLSDVAVDITVNGEGNGEVRRGRGPHAVPAAAWASLSGVVRDHGGTLEADSAPAGGIRVRIRLPALEEQKTSGHGGRKDDAHGGRTASAQPVPVARLETSPEALNTREPAFPERRRSPRFDLRIETRLSLNGSAWTGTVLSIGLGGLYMVFSDTIPAAERQPIQLGFVSEVGVLEIRGAVRGIREATAPKADTSGTARYGLAIEFAPLGSPEAEILSSLLEGLRQGSVSVKLTVLLIPQETGDLLLEVSSTGTEAIQQPDSCPAPIEAREGTIPERRLSSRINLAVPAHVEVFDRSSECAPQTAVTANLSVSGACVRLHTPRVLLGQRLLVRLSPPQNLIAQTAGTAAALREYTLAGEVVWSIPDPGAQEKPRDGSPAKPLRVGVRFLHLNDDAQRGISDLVGRFLTSPARLEEWAEESRLISELKECRDERSRRIVLYHDHPRNELPPGSPLIIISPGYGETKKEYVTLAYYLASNGFHVLRYDYTNHVGESDGDIVRTTLTGMRQDLCAIVDYAERTWPASPVAVIACSLGGRVALKAAAHDRRVKLLVLLTGIVDVQATLLAVHHDDLIGTYLQGMRRGVTNVLGFNVDLDRFSDDAIREGYSDLRTTIQDAGEIGTPVILITAEHDVWVRQDSVREVQTALGSHLRHFYLIPEALHRLHENPRKARAVFRQLVTCCREEFYPLSSRLNIAEPSQREIGLQNRLERERARAQHQMAKTQTIEFWKDYLDHFHYIVNFSDYWHLLDHIYRLMGTCDRGELILDAGCGNGNFGMFLMINHAYRQRHTLRADAKPPLYLGLDFVPSALAQARTNLVKVAAEAWGQFAGASFLQVPIRTSLTRADLNLSLPFRDNQFDRIVCNLVIAYLQDPLFTLRELVRVLSPNGRLVLTNLKPHADLSQIYRNFVQVTEGPEEVEEARRLLSNSGKIKQGESDGIFSFYDRQELATLLITSGAVEPRIYSTFANQAHIAVAEKPGGIFTRASMPSPNPLEPRAQP